MFQEKLCDYCLTPMEVRDNGSEMVFRGNEITPPEFKDTWILWWCPECDKVYTEYLE